MSVSSLIRRRSSSNPRPRTRLGLEALEDRLAPANLVDVGGLRFMASDGFEVSGHTYTATTGSVSIGYIPSGTEEFLPLLRSDLSHLFAAFTVVDQPGAPTFNVDTASVKLVVIGGPSTPLGIPIWNESVNELTVDINQLVGNNGFSVPSTVTPRPFTVADVDFSLSSLTFNNPDGGDTSDAQVKMQGTASFDNVPLVEDLGIRVSVDGTNYAIADSAGVDLTGLKVHVPIPTQASILGMKVSGEIDVSYTEGSKSFEIGGGVTLSSAEEPEGNVHFNSLGAELDVTVASGALTELGFEIEGNLQLGGLNVSTPQDQGLSFQWNKSDNSYNVGGALQLQFNDSTILANFGSSTAPGIVVKDGQLQSLAGYVTGDIVLSKASVSSQGITVNYNRDQGLFEMSGDLTLQVPTGDTTQMLAARMFDSTGGPGLVLKNGELQKLSLELSGGFSVYGLSLAVTDAGVEWQKDPDTGANELLVSGTFMVDFKAVQTTVTLGQDNNPGLKIANGTFDLQSFRVELTDAHLGPVTLQDLVVSYAPGQGGIDLDVQVWAVLPGGWAAQGELDIINGKLDTISLDMSAPPGKFMIGDTGLSLIDVHAKVTNIENPSQIVVSGGVAVVWGDQFPLLGQNVYPFRVEGDFTADANEFILDATAQLGAYSNDGGVTWQGVAGQGEARLDLDWGARNYALHVEIDGLFSVFDLTGDFTFAVGQDIRFLAEVDVVVPNFVPFIGGDRLGGLGFFFDHTLQNPITTTVAAWIELHIIRDIEVGFEVVFDPNNPNGKWSLIGADTIDGFKKEAQPPVDRTYTYTADLATLIPGNATSATMQADWSKSAAGVTLVGRPTFRVQHTRNNQTVIWTEDQFAANGIALITDPRLDTPTSKAIQIVGSVTDEFATLQGDYKLLIDLVAEGGNPFPNYGKSGIFADDLAVQATYHLPPPTFGPKGSSDPYVPAVPQTPADKFTVTLHGNMDEGFLGDGSKARVSLYRVLLQDPQQSPVLLGSVTPTQVSGGGVNWQAQIDVPVGGLHPLPYVLYAVVNDGFNAPVKTELSASFTPAFAVQGGVANQLGDAMPGWTVFLDYDQDGTQDSNEPSTTTSTPDGFYAFTTTFDPSTGWAPVPVSTPTEHKPFNVVLVVPGPDDFAPVAPVTTTYHGTATKLVSFTVREKTAITGVAFNDDGQDGNPADGTPLAGATVYLDINGNGRRDAGEPTQLTGTDGTYAFRNLAAGTYTVALDVNAETPAAAYVVPAGTVGNQTQAGAVGMAFTVTSPIDVTSLGVFDSGGDGFHGTLTATLYDRVTQKAVATMQFTAADPGTLAGGSRFKALAQPITLYAGFQGLIVAEGFSSQDPWGSNGTNPTWTLDGGSNNLSFTGSGVSGPVGQYPTLLGNSPVVNPYAAGSFLFTDPVRVQTSPAGNTYTVTLDDSGFDVEADNDFGVQPFSTVSGTISERLRNNGELGPVTPEGGVPVQLLQNGIVVGATTTSSTGDYSFNGLRPGTYAVAQTIPEGFRQVTPFSGDFQLQNPTGANTWSLPGGLAPMSTVMADFDANGQLDLVVLGASPDGPSSAGDVNVFVYYNGNFSQPVGLRGGAAGVPQTVVAANVANGIGLPDLVLLYQNGTVTVLPNQGGRLADGSVQWTLPLDNSLQTYSDLAAGHFSAVTPGGNQFAALRWDFPTDNYSVVLFHAGGTVQVAATGAGIAATMAAADVTGEGFTDLFVENSSTPPVVLASDGNGGLTPTTIGSLPSGNDGSDLPALAVGDINGDGLADLAVSDFSLPEAFVPISYVIQNADGTFGQSLTPGIGAAFTVDSMALKDVNGDLRPDLVWVGSDTGVRQLYVALNTGTPGAWFTTAQQTTWPLAVGPGDSYGLEMGDLDKDGLLDLVVTDFTNGLVNLVSNRSTIRPPLAIAAQVQPGQNPTGLDFLNAQFPLPGIGDFGFEAPAAPFASPPATNSLYWYNASGSQWTFTGGSGISSNGSVFTGSNLAPQGTQVAFLQGTGSFSQTVHFEAGTYSISFQAAQRPSNSQTFQVKVDNVVVGTFTPSGTSYQSFTTDSFPVSAGNHTITFVGLDPNGGDNTAFVDAVTVQPVPDVGDFGFETPAVGSISGAYSYRPTTSPWTFTGQSGVSGKGAFTGGNPAAPQGTQVAFLQGTGSFSQSVYFPAGTYTLSFEAAQRAGNTQTFQVLVGSTVVGTFTPNGTSYQSFTSNSFPVAAGYQTISFVGLNPKGGDNTAFIDSVSVQAAQSPDGTQPVPLTPAAPVAVQLTGPTADPVLSHVAVQRSRQSGTPLGATLTFNVPVNLNPRALRLVQRKKGGRVKDLSRWVRVVMVVQDGQTWVQLRLRSLRGELLAPGRYSLFVQHDLVRNALTDAPLTGSGASSHTEIRLTR